MSTATPAGLAVARRRAGERRRAERRLAYWLCAPAATVMLVVVGYPLLELLWLSVHGSGGFVGVANYIAVLGSGAWWSAFGVTLAITVAGTTLAMGLGLLLAFVMHRTPVGRGTVRAAVLVPYAAVSVVAALGVSWMLEGALPVTERWSALAVVVLAEVWRTVPFVALVLMAGLALVPEEMLTAAAMDGAGAWQRFTAITAPMLRPALLAALVFRVLDTFRTFDAVYVLTRGREGTASVSVLAHRAAFAGDDPGRGSTMAVLVLLAAVALVVAAVLVVDRVLPRSRE